MFIKNFIDHKVFEPMLNVYDYFFSKVMSISKGVYNIVHWAPIIYKFSCHDYLYILNICKFAVKENITFYSTLQNGSQHTAFQKDTIKSLKQVYKTLDNIQNHDYFDYNAAKELRKKYKLNHKGINKYLKTFSSLSKKKQDLYKNAWLRLFKEGKNRKGKEFDVLCEELKRLM